MDTPKEPPGDEISPRLGALIEELEPAFANCDFPKRAKWLARAKELGASGKTLIELLGEEMDRVTATNEGKPNLIDGVGRIKIGPNGECIPHKWPAPSTDVAADIEKFMGGPWDRANRR